MANAPQALERLTHWALATSPWTQERRGYKSSQVWSQEGWEVKAPLKQGKLCMNPLPMMPEEMKTWG